MGFFNGDFFNNYVSPFSTWLGLATFLFSVLIYAKVTFGREWQIKKWRNEALSSSVDRPAALIIDMLGKGGELDAEKFLNQQFGSGKVQVLKWVRSSSGGDIAQNDVSKLVLEFRQKLQDLSKFSADRIYLFISAPTPIIAIVAAELANFGGIVLMHWNRQDATYENWGPLRHP